MHEHSCYIATNYKILTSTAYEHVIIIIITFGKEGKKHKNLNIISGHTERQDRTTSFPSKHVAAAAASSIIFPSLKKTKSEQIIKRIRVSFGVF